MGLATHSFPPAIEGARDDRRAAPRYTSLIRAAKLVCDKGEFVCVVRDVSAGGVRLRCFHAAPDDPAMALELQNGERFAIDCVRNFGTEASFSFREQGVEVQRLIRENWKFPRRPLRLAITHAVVLRTASGQADGKTLNISQQGCRIETTLPLALAQSVLVEIPNLPRVRAKVRWRNGGECGLVFDDTFTLSDFAIHAARIQCPALLPGG